MNTHYIESSARLASISPGDTSKTRRSSGQLNKALSSGTTQDISSLPQKMSLLNLGAALAVWKSYENKMVQSASEQYRSRMSSSLRLSPGRTGSLPSGLLGHWMSSDR